MMRIQCTINGEQVEREIQPGQTLLELLRRDLGLTGTKQGCAVGECGACTVIIDGETVDSCLYLAAWADGKNIRSIEGEAREGELSDMQQAFVEQGAVQCGFCIPGFIMSATNLVEASGHVGREEIRVGLSGNLCRCTGYTNIIRSVEAVVREKYGEKES